jgi:hypothetical protein
VSRAKCAPDDKLRDTRRQVNLTAEANKAARKLTAICEKSSEGKDKQQEQERVWKAAEPKSKIQFTGVGGLPA